MECCVKSVSITCSPADSNCEFIVLWKEPWGKVGFPGEGTEGSWVPKHPGSKECVGKKVKKTSVLTYPSSSDMADGPKVRARVGWLFPSPQEHHWFLKTNFKILKISNNLRWSQWACVKAEPWRREEGLP